MPIIRLPIGVLEKPELIKILKKSNVMILTVHVTRFILVATFGRSFRFVS